ncbi:hypothetical protein E4T56_gene7693 [Termitomyces sp. T112]|nr:hypothetical protein E4T56_gene7693 [Termitomyces sp. T112]
MNFAITSKLVVVPIYGTAHDADGVAAIAELFPDRATVGIMADAILAGGRLSSMRKARAIALAATVDHGLEAMRVFVVVGCEGLDPRAPVTVFVAPWVRPKGIERTV